MKLGLPMVPVAFVLLAGVSLVQGAEALSSSAREAATQARYEAVAMQAQRLIDAERQRPRIAGVWRISDPVALLRTLEGRVPPLNATGLALQRQRTAGLKARRSEDPMDRCLPPGTPRILWMDAPFLITQAPSKVTVFHQARHLVRHVWSMRILPGRASRQARGRATRWWSRRARSMVASGSMRQGYRSQRT